MNLSCRTHSCFRTLPDGTGSRGGEMICGACRSARNIARQRGLKWAREMHQVYEYRLGRIEEFQPKVLQITKSAREAVDDAKARARAALQKTAKNRQAVELH